MHAHPTTAKGELSGDKLENMGEKTQLKKVSCNDLLKHIFLYRNFQILLLPNSLIHLLNLIAVGDENQNQSFASMNS